MQLIVDKEGEGGREGKAIGDDSYDVEKGFVDNTLWLLGCMSEVLSRSNRTRK